MEKIYISEEEIIKLSQCMKYTTPAWSLFWKGLCSVCSWAYTNNYFLHMWEILIGGNLCACRGPSLLIVPEPIKIHHINKKLLLVCAHEHTLENPFLELLFI